MAVLGASKTVSWHSCDGCHQTLPCKTQRLAWTRGLSHIRVEVDISAPAHTHHHCNPCSAALLPGVLAAAGHSPCPTARLLHHAHCRCSPLGRHHRSTLCPWPQPLWLPVLRWRCRQHTRPAKQHRIGSSCRQLSYAMSKAVPDTSAPPSCTNSCYGGTCVEHTGVC